MSKGSRPRKITNQKQFEENWDKIFARKKTPPQGRTQIHKDKTKEDKYWDSQFEEQCQELYGDNMPDIEDVQHFKTYPDGGDID